VAGLALASGVLVRPAAAATSVLAVAFAGAVVINLVRGRRIDCGCFGGARDRPISWWVAGRASLLAAVSAALAARPPLTLSIPVPWAQAELGQIAVTDGIAALLIALFVVFALALGSQILQLRNASDQLLREATRR
jgi:hypothetical protein